VCAVIAVVLFTVTVVYCARTPLIDRTFRDELRRVLLLIAHPDDECMFFAPTILALLARGVDVHVLCMTSGELSTTVAAGARKDELRMACRHLGVPDAHVTIIEHTKIKDGMTTKWPRPVISKMLMTHIETYNIDTLLTFDSYGVSGHTNHIALYDTVRALYERQSFPTYTRVFTLESVNIVRKYVGVLDLFATLNTAPFYFVSSGSDVRRTRLAMRAHVSQMRWFRWLYIYVSRYIHINSWRRLSARF